MPSVNNKTQYYFRIGRKEKNNKTQEHHVTFKFIISYKIKSNNNI